MDRYSQQHLRWLMVILIGIPVSILLINVVYMQRFLVSKIQLDEVPLNARLAKEVVRLRWINSAHAKELLKVKSKFKEIRMTGKEEPVISVTFFAKYAYKRMKVLRNVVRCLGSILDHSKADLHFHVLLDSPSKMRITRTLTKLMTDKRKFKVSYHYLEPIFMQFEDVIKRFRHYFFTKDVGRYDDDIFFISQIFHKIRPFKPLEKLIMLDLDTKFRVDITKLWSEFDAIKGKEVMAMAYDQQPQYRYDFALYRSKHPNTDVGGPHPGRQGFNTGVVLFDLKRMRESKLYNDLLKENAISSLCEKYEFRGYMGHQDFYTLTLMEHPELYRVLNCSWNRQLDTGWKKNSGLKIFNQYHSCPGAIHIYHGNGEAFIPER